MAEMGEIGPGGMIPYGARVDARDIENYRGPDPAAWLTGLFRAVLQAAIAAEGLHYLVPQVTDRIRSRDGGVDAALTIELPLSGQRTAGLVNPGKTIYQFKWRSKRESILQAASEELKKLKDRSALPDYYVFVTNIDLTIPEHDKVKKELRKRCKKFPADHIVVVGASELRDRVNNDPRIRVAYFAVALGLCTLESAREAAERRYGNRDAPPPLFDRVEEIAALRRFLDDSEGRAIVVSGPQGVGKTRIVSEALSSSPERVVWAREVPSQPTGLIQVLDESPHPAILVIEVDAQPEMVLRKALEAARLKTIVIYPWPTVAPGAANLPVRPLSDSDSEKLLGQLFPEMPYSHPAWLYDNFGGFPGLLLPAAVALQSGIGPDPLQEPQYEAILQAYEDRMLAGLGPPAVEALEPLCILPSFQIPTGSDNDLQALCSALGIDIAKVRRNFELLRARNLVEQAGFRDNGYFQVTPPLLARRIAKRVMRSVASQLSTLYGQLSPERRTGFVRRVAELQDEPAVRRFLSWLFSKSGLFVDVQSIASNAASIRALAETVPVPTGRELHRVLEEATFEEWRAALANSDQWPPDKNRWEIVSALVALVQRTDTFEDGAKGLLSLAEVEQVENRGWTGNASRIFTEIFHWRHPHIPRDARLRARFLSSLVSSDSPRKRCVVAKAASHCLETQYALHAWRGEGVAPPESGWRATLWGEVHDALRPVVQVLRKLATDSDPDTRDEAIHGLSIVGGIVTLGLAEEATAALEFLATCPLDGSQRSQLVEGVALLLATLQKVVAVAEGNEWRVTLQSCMTRGETLFTQLTSGDFRSRFFHWLGPTPLRAHRRMGERASYTETIEQGKKLAAETLANPSLFENDLQDWVTDVHAQNGGYFLRHLGELDCGRTWLQALGKRLGRPNGVSALGIYVAGWYAAAQEEAESYLDSVAGRGGKWSEAVVDATWRIGGSSQGAKRFLRCVAEGGVDRTHLARRLAWGSWYETLSIEDFLNLVAGLRYGTPNVDWALLETFLRFWSDRREAWDQLGPVAIELLSNTAGAAPPQHDIHDWDSLAAALVEWNADAGFNLLFAHLQKGERGHSVFLAHHRNLLIEALSVRDRPRLVRMFLETSLKGPEKWSVMMELPNLLHPETDTAVLFQFAQETGLEAAGLVANNLDADLPGFWEMLPDFIARWGDDAEVRSGILRSITDIRNVYSDKAAILRPRLDHLEKLAAHPDPLTQDVVRQAKEELLREMKSWN